MAEHCSICSAERGEKKQNKVETITENLYDAFSIFPSDKSHPPTFSQTNLGAFFIDCADEGGVLREVLREALQSHSIAELPLRDHTFAFELIVYSRTGNICVDDHLLWSRRPKEGVAFSF